MNKLVLFDIDKTLITSSKAHDLAFSAAFKNVYGFDTNQRAINHHGMTDQQIIIEVIKKQGLTEAEVRAKLKECMQYMVDFYHKNSQSDEIAVLDGVRELLEELSKHDILMGLVTGNLEPIARGKLTTVRLNHYFKVGGFGSDDINRSKLVKLAIKRAESQSFVANNNVFLFGDAPADMQAGKKRGAVTIGVTTGIFSREELLKAGAQYILPNLKDTDKILKIILSF